MAGIIQELCSPLRKLRRTPGCAGSGGEYALGIGANKAFFSLLNAILLHDLPSREPQQVVLFSKATKCVTAEGF